MAKLDNKLSNLNAAVKRLKEAVAAYKSDPANSLYRDALIQRFEFTFELVWKTLAAFLNEQGIADFMPSPKAVFKAAYGAGCLDDEQIWLDILEARNCMSHLYDE